MKQQILQQYPFNENGKIRRKDFLKFVMKLKPFEDFIKDGNKSTKKSNDQKIDSDALAYAEKIQDTIQESQELIKEQLLCTFYNLTQVEVEDLDFETFEVLYNQIEEKRPNLIDFLCLPPIKNGVKAIS